MEKKYINPDTLMTPRGYTHVVTVSGASKMVFVSGQVAVDKAGKLVGPGDLKAQILQAGANLKAALAAAGATPQDIVKTNTYIVNYKQSDYSAMREARAALFPEGDPPASTLVGVSALAVDGLMVEMEAIAAVK
ncbi:MAG: RidA family protein [Candidatus Binatus sp.]|uniref:RidA family protein n=1 Tax=Candidatus Binatus sp. TaxID=2811406 RepID=UPI0027269DF0|nr:RidA family protein [Candidatus Binatus sp.]MDO8434779.1 RidA family protein [Candidatus Binatus sp.]